MVKNVFDRGISNFCGYLGTHNTQHDSALVEPPAISRSGKLIQYCRPRRATYIGYKAPLISSVMQGPKTNPFLDNLPLSTLKRKAMSSKVLTHISKKKIDTKVINVSNMAGVLASAFQVLTFSLFIFLSVYVIDHLLLQSSGLISQLERTTTADFDQDKVLEETPVDDILVSSNDQSEPHQKVDASADQL
jgi:hypothetical protein